MSKHKTRIWIIILIIVFLTLNYIKLPYYLNLPGDAYDLKKIVEVRDGDHASGAFMMTTVGVSRSKINIFAYVWSFVAPYHELIPAENMRRQGESDKEYYYRQIHMMDMSQNVAVALAYEKANKQVNYLYNGVYVMSLIKGMDAANKLKIGDRIFKVDGKSMKQSEEFIKYVADLLPGDTVTLTLERDGDILEKEITLNVFPGEPEKHGVGISLVTDRKLDVEPEILIDTNKVGGPSAGLMFSLEIYNQLTEGDLTKGYKIAGTGTINYEGIVGPIGGISQKIVAADRAGAKYFLAPNENGVPNSNYRDALQTVRDINSDMEVIPVDTFEDALTFLNSLNN
ncbi:SepM family pheromone-processing serine protease [Bacillus salitolerans]|uniref:endopeptidase La n=1 Tax=Bacillus salitolerans TaxID=1437434 RepID=A0ABW4LNU2_9BACI